MALHASGIAASRANADYLGHALEELRQLAPERGEEEALASRRQLMMNAEKIAAELNEALDALQGEGTGGARLAAALRRIERQASVGGAVLALVAEALERVLAETNTARARIEEALALTAFEPKELERAEERLFALRALARKHKVMSRRPARADRQARGRACRARRERGPRCRARKRRGLRPQSL